MGLLIVSPKAIYLTKHSGITNRFWPALLVLSSILLQSNILFSHSAANFTPQSISWTGGINSDWATAGNWNPAIVPTANDNVTIPNTGTAPVIDGLTAAARSVVVELNAQLTISASGSLAIDGAEFDGLISEGTISNSGTLTIGSNVGEFSAGMSNRGTFINADPCAVFRLSSRFESFLSFTNNGLFTIDTDEAASAGGTFTNNGVLEYRQVNAITGVTNNGLIIAPVEFSVPSCGFPQTVVLEIGNSNSFTASSVWYKEEAKINQAGTYDEGTNTFTPTDLPTAPNTLYFTVSTSSCTHDVSINYSTLAIDGGTATWTGFVSSDWEEACNWSTGIVPGDNTRVIIAPADNDCQIPATANVSANSIAIESGATLTLTDGILSIVGDTISIDIFGTLNNGGEIYITKSSTAEDAITSYGTLINNNYIEILEGGTGVRVESGSTFENTGVIFVLDASLGVQILTDCQNDGTIVCGGNAAFGFVFATNSFTNSTTGQITTFSSGIYGVGSFGGTFTNNGEIDTEADELGLSVEIGEFINGATGTIEAEGRIAGVNVDGGVFQNNGDLQARGNFDADAFRVVSGPATNNGSILINEADGNAISIRESGVFTNRATINIGQSDDVEDDIEDHGIDNAGTFDNQGTINIDDIGLDGINHSGLSFLNTGNINIGMGLVENITRYGFRATEGFTNEGTINVDHTGNDAIRLSSAVSSNSGNINIGQNSSTGTTGILLNQSAELQNLTVGDINIDNYAIGLKTAAGGGTFTNTGNISFENNATYAVESLGDFDNDGLISGEGAFVLSSNELGGLISPGFSPGTISFPQDMEFLENSLLIIEVQGTIANTFDLITGSGDIDISNSTLNTTISHTPNDGDRIAFLTANTISGEFTAISPALPAGWLVDYSVTGEVALVFNAALPVELLAFQATKEVDAVLLEWQTASETNNEGFAILHSSDGLDWKDIGFVFGKGDTQRNHFYSFTHPDPVKGNNYYRLRQFDFDGRFEDSTIRMVKFDYEPAADRIDIYPNPTVDFAQITLPSRHDHGQVMVTNAAGLQVYSREIPAGQAQVILNVQDWPTGTYLVQLQLGPHHSTYKLLRSKN